MATRGNKLGYEKKSTPTAYNISTTRDLEWAAGFLEGEGNFQAKGGSHCATVSACQNNPDPLTKLQSFFGGTVKRRTRIIKGNTKMIYWNWQVYGSRARGIMMTIYSMLSELRQTQVLEALGA